MDALGFNEGIGRLPRAERRSSVLLIALSIYAAIYPSILMSGASLISVLDLPSAWQITFATALALLAASIVLLISYIAVRSAKGALSRILCLLAFTTPTLIVAIGNFAGVLNVRSAVPEFWPILWICLLAAALFFPNAGPEGAVLAPKARSRLATTHGMSACTIIILFLAPHLSNHLTGLWNGATHIAVMKDLRLIYRNEIIEPILFALIVFQIASGLVLVSNRIGRRETYFATLQTLTGVYVAIFFVGHVTAVLAARHTGTDTNWNWLTDNDNGLLTNLSSITLVGHYWVGPIALLTHIACGLRAFLLQRRVSLLRVNRLAIGLMGFAILASSAILAGLLGVHLA